MAQSRPNHKRWLGCVLLVLQLSQSSFKTTPRASVKLATNYMLLLQIGVSCNFSKDVLNAGNLRYKL